MNTKLKKLISEAGKPFYSRGEWHDSNMSGGTPIRVTKWDALVDEYNGKRGYSTSTKSNTRIYQAEIENLAVGMTWRVSFVNGGWNYRVYKRGQLVELQRNLDELIAHFKDNNNANELKTENAMKLKSLLLENMQRFRTKNISEDASVNEELKLLILDALYDIIAQNQNTKTPDTVIDDMLERGAAKEVADKQMMPLVEQLTPVIEDLIEICNNTEYNG